MMKSGFYTTTSNDQLSGWTEKKLQVLPKAKLHPKKVMVTVWWSAAHLIPCSSLNLRETLHLRSTLSKPVRCTENGTPAAGIRRQRGAVLSHHSA